MTSDPWDQIRKRFIERCRGDLHRLRGLRSSNAHRDRAEATSMLAAIAHSLAGAGGTLGFPEISTKAFELESMLLEEDLSDRTIAALDQLILTLERLAGSSK